jgi:hypothetical protein
MMKLARLNTVAVLFLAHTAVCVPSQLQRGNAVGGQQAQQSNSVAQTGGGAFDSATWLGALSLAGYLVPSAAAAYLAARLLRSERKLQQARMDMERANEAMRRAIFKLQGDLEYAEKRRTDMHVAKAELDFALAKTVPALRRHLGLLRNELAAADPSDAARLRAIEKRFERIETGLQRLLRSEMYIEKVWRAPPDMPQDVEDCVRAEALFQVT